MYYWISLLFDIYKEQFMEKLECVTKWMVSPFVYFPQLLAFVKTLFPVYAIQVHVKLISQIQV